MLNHHVSVSEHSETVATQFSVHSITCDRLLGYGLQNELESNHTLVRLELSLNCNILMILPILTNTSSQQLVHVLRSTPWALKGVHTYLWLIPSQLVAVIWGKLLQQ